MGIPWPLMKRMTVGRGEDLEAVCFLRMYPTCPICSFCLHYATPPFCFFCLVPLAFWLGSWFWTFGFGSWAGYIVAATLLLLCVFICFEAGLGDRDTFFLIHGGFWKYEVVGLIWVPCEIVKGVWGSCGKGGRQGWGEVDSENFMIEASTGPPLSLGCSWMASLSAA